METPIFCASTCGALSLAFLFSSFVFFSFVFFTLTVLLLFSLPLKKMKNSQILLSLFLTISMVTCYVAPSPSENPRVNPDYAADSHYAYYQNLYSFFPPFSLEHNAIPHWTFGGSTMLFENYVRLTPDLPDRRGWMWGEEPVELERWEAIFALKISGKGRIHGDGVAFWWQKNPEHGGPIFGGMNQWEGLGILIDTYDNDHNGKHPYLSAFWNDGTTEWDHDNDGGKAAEVGCKIKPNFRNKGAIQVVVSYFIDRIQVLIFDEEKEKWYDCLNMTLPSGIDTSEQFFGFTAQTGSVSDNYDILSFEVYDMQKMEEDGHHHEHVNPSLISHDDSFLGIILNILMWGVGVLMILGVIYTVTLLVRAKEKKRGPII